MADEWDGKTERRTHIRRAGDRDVCPFHKIKCDSIHENKINIRNIEANMVTKSDLKGVIEDIRTKSPRWVVITMITITTAMLGWMVLRMEDKFDSIYVMKANQQILLKAFHIEPVATVKEAEKKLNGVKENKERR